MVKLPKFLRFGAKSAKRYTVDSGYKYQPKENPNKSTTLKVRDYISSDPDLSSAMRKFVDNILLEMPKIIKTHNSKIADSTVESYNQQLKDVRFYKKMRNAVYSLIYDGNAFFEIKFRGKKLTELYNIDPDTMKIETNEVGEPIEYVQQIGENPEVRFLPEEIVHITIDHLQTGEWGMAFMKPLESALLRKDIAEDYLQWLIQNNKFAPIIIARTRDSMTPEELGRIKAEIDVVSADPDRSQFLNFDPEDQLEIMKIYDTDNFNDLMSYIDKQKEAVINLLQVPPIISGTVDNSNRSNSEIQARFVFYNTIKAFQNMTSEELDFEMLRKLGWKDVRFKFPEADKRSETDIIKIAKSLRADLNFTQEAILEYLKENGFKIPQVSKIFEEVPVDQKAANIEDSPSREPRDKTGIPENEALRQEDKKLGVSANEN